MSHALALLVALCAQAQPSSVATDLLGSDHLVPRDSVTDLRFGFNIAGRVSFPMGSLGGVTASVGGTPVTVQNSIGYDDLFDSGVGVAIGLDILFPQGQMTNERRPTLYTGGYLSVGWDQFGGNRVSDGLGNSIDAEDLWVESFLLGFKARLALQENTFLSAQIGAGGLHYAAVDATVTGAATGPVRLFEADWSAAFEGRVRVAWQFGRLGLFAGTGVRIINGPQEGPGVDFSPGMLWLWDFELGLDVAF
jgi:hypothetical protein